MKNVVCEYQTSNGILRTIILDSKTITIPKLDKEKKMMEVILLTYFQVCGEIVKAEDGTITYKTTWVHSDSVTILGYISEGILIPCTVDSNIEENEIDDSEETILPQSQNSIS